MQKVRISGITVDRLLQTAEMFKGFRKKTSVLKQLDGKYSEAGIEMKKQGITSTELIREIREVK
ncbi:MAG: hypothetical protein M1610_09650 [Nitrospirae bacterium]|nr:hypothetical protein [Nitrospirota bacterium]MDA8340320.1 hypothetical protein [Nitrospiraceae bacterium]